MKLRSSQCTVGPSTETQKGTSSRMSKHKSLFWEQDSYKQNFPQDVGRIKGLRGEYALKMFNKTATYLPATQNHNLNAHRARA